MDIQLDIDVLMNHVIQHTESVLGEIDTTMVSTCNSIATLTISGWEGKAKDEFLTQFYTFKSEMRTFYDNLKLFNECLNKIYRDGEDVYVEGDTLLNAL